MEKKVLYINACARSESRTAEYFGIPETELICAEMLDVEGFDADNLVAQQIGQIQKRKLL